jgi:ribosome-associated protein
VANGETTRLSDSTSPRRNLRAWIVFHEGGPLKLATVRSVPAKRIIKAGLERALLCARVAYDNKARDVLILDMRGITPLYDYLVLATGGSRRQVHNIAEEVDDVMTAEGDVRLGIEGYEAGKWVVQDYGDVVLHLFDPEMRKYYALDELWADAKRVDWRID